MTTTLVFALSDAKEGDPIHSIIYILNLPKCAYILTFSMLKNTKFALKIVSTNSGVKIFPFSFKLMNFRLRSFHFLMISYLTLKRLSTISMAMISLKIYILLS